MPSPEPESPDDSFFNDLSQQPHESGTTNNRDAPNENASKQKRIACVLCRKRKLRCDGTRPACGTCTRLSHPCAYDEVRKKSGPKRGYVKQLEQRLQQVETLLRNQDTNDTNRDTSRQDSATAYVAKTLSQALPNAQLDVPNGLNIIQDSRAQGIDASRNENGEQDYSWEMIGLGLEEPLPPQDVMDELYEIYFTRVHPSLPVIHRPRFLAALNLAPHMRPPICLRYIMWTLAASAADKYEALQEHFYHRARKYAQLDEMKGHGESTITLAHCQSWILTCIYEFKSMDFPRAWLSAGRAVRLSQMMQLHRLDGSGLDVKQCLPPPKDWTEREERRRTFWMAFCVDRYASIGTGWPMTIDERDIMTNLPASDDAFEKNRPMTTGTLDSVLNPSGIAILQPFGAIVFTAAMFGRNLLHLHRPTPDDNDDDINGEYWNRHRKQEQILLQTSLGLPDHLRLPNGLSDPNVIFSNMCIHTSAICLHQAAIFKADRNRLPANVSNESKIRCVTAAAEIASIMRTISHMDLSSMNPFISFCVYVAARVFVQYLKTRPKDQQMMSSLQFLLQAMQALRRKNPLTESFLVQLDLDLEMARLPGMEHKPYQPVTTQPTVIPEDSDPVSCTPFFEIRDTQGAGSMANARNGNSNHLQGVPTFGSNVVAGVPMHNPSTQFAATNTPGPPFHVSNINNMNMHTNQTAQYIPSQISAQSGLATSISHDFNSTAFSFPESHEMDLSGSGDRSNEHPSPATVSSQSRVGSTSQSSLSPGNMSQEHHLPYRASPKPGFAANPSASLPGRTAAAASTAFPSFSSPGTSAVEMFSQNFSTSGAMSDEAFHQGFLVGNDWEYGLGAPAGQGMTPMSEGTWNQMLESVTMGWDSGMRGQSGGAGQ